MEAKGVDGRTSGKVHWDEPISTSACAYDKSKPAIGTPLPNKSGVNVHDCQFFRSECLLIDWFHLNIIFRICLALIIVSMSVSVCCSVHVVLDKGADALISQTESHLNRMGSMYAIKNLLSVFMGGTGQEAVTAIAPIAAHAAPTFLSQIVAYR